MGNLNLKKEQPETKYEVSHKSMDIVGYCKPLLSCTFHGQTTVKGEERTDQTNTKEVLNLGLYLSLIDKLMRQYDPKEFTGDEEEYLQLLKLIALKRRKEKESTEQCYRRLIEDSKRFICVYRQRGVVSEPCEHDGYWGSHQQLLAGKVVGDWIDTQNGPIDIIYGVLLNPTGGRVGPGDSGWIHNLLFDDTGYMAYHSAVHDSFGYLKTNHDVGPGYDYMHSHTLDGTNPMAGQMTGISYWKDVIEDVQKNLTVINKFKI